MRLLPLALVLSACTGATALDARLVVRTLAPDGSPLPVTRVGFHDVGTFEVPLRPLLTELACAEEGEAPCDAWVLDDADLPGRIHVLAELEQPDRTYPSPLDMSCFYWSTQHTIVHFPEGAEGQQVHLVLDPEMGWCESLLTAGPTDPIPAPTVHPDDVRAAPTLPEGSEAVLAEDAEGAPIPLLTATWYYNPESPEYDGEVPLVCADQLCTRWLLPDGNGPDDAFYVAGTYAGPYHPLQGAAFSDYQGSPVAWTEGAAELPVTLTFDTTLAPIQ